MTGGTGFIGRNFIQMLQDRYEIVSLNRNRSNISILKNLKCKIYTYSDYNEILTIFMNEQFDGVIHFASNVLVQHEYRNINCLITDNITYGTYLLEFSKATKVKWFINTGTFWQHYQNENYNPVNLYAATKQAFEDIAKYYTETSDLIFVTLKLNDTFGPNDTRNKVFNLWHKFSRTDKILEMSPGEQIIDISYIEDIINAYEILIEYLFQNTDIGKNKVFAIHSNERMSLKDLSKVFEESIGTTLNICWGGREYREREVMIPWSNTQQLPGWKQKYSLKEAIQKTIGAMK